MVFENISFVDFGLGALFGTFIIMILVYLLISYIITGVSLYRIAKRTKTDNAWLAWVPIFNLLLVADIGKESLWLGLITILVGFVPFIGGIISAVLVVYLFWRVNEKLKKPGILALLTLIPVVQLFYLLYLAYSK